MNKEIIPIFKEKTGCYPTIEEIDTLRNKSAAEIEFYISEKLKNEREDFFFEKREETQLFQYLLSQNSKNFYFLKEMLLHRKNKRYLILTKVAYPFGGGESFMHQTIEWLSDVGFEVYWISFSDKNHVAHSRNENYIEEGCHFYKVSGGVTPQNLRKSISLISPDVIHIQGVMSILAIDEILSMRIPTIIGYHFWFGLLESNRFGGFNNIDIIKNIKLHTVSDFYLRCGENHLISQYVVSDFMNAVLRSAKTKEVENVIYATSSDHQFLNEYRSPFQKKYVSLININVLKGGDIFLEITKKMNLPFIGVCTEANEGTLDEDIRKSIEKKKGLFLHYTNVKRIYDDTRILLIPGHVDETFCRVAYEGAASGIPIITTGVGFIREMLGDSAIYLSSNPEEWIATIEGLYHNRFALEFLSSKLRERSKIFTTNKFLLQKLILEKSLLSKSNNIMIFCPWCDQGLGIQARMYCSLLRECGYSVHIFSFLPFLAYRKNHYFQKNKEEWEGISDTVYYSYNDREGVTFQELEHFVYSRNIGKCIIPEVCFLQIYQKVDFLNSLGVKVYAVPNIETVRKNEIDYYPKFEKILLNTRVCERILNSIFSEENKKKLHYIGHYSENIIEMKIFEKFNFEEWRFLHISGYNASTRKQTLKVCQAFKLIYEDINIPKEVVNKIKLRITSSRNISEELLPYVQCEGISFDTRNISYREIREMYASHHISIQVASHEGLGLGFYESIGENTPVISLDCEPHNEIVTPESGWLLKCEPFDLKDNDQALVKGYSFSPMDLKKLIVSIVLEGEEKMRDKISSLSSFREKWKIKDFAGRFIEGLE